MRRANRRRGWALLVAAGTLCSVSGCFYAEPEAYVRSFAWESDGTSWTWEFRIPTDLYALYRRQTQRPWCSDESCDWYRYVTDPNDDAYVEALAAELARVMGERYTAGQLYHKTLQFTLDFVTAAIPYTTDQPEEWPKYPIETLVEGRGDCEDTAILYTSLVRPLGHGVHLILLAQHVAVGVEVHPSFIENAPYEVGYYTYAGTYYVFCETTGDPETSGYIPVGYLPPAVRDEFLSDQWFFYDLRLGAASQATAELSTPTANRTDPDWLRWTELP
ncbi:MAG: hypothetical protein PHZ21_01965 [Candidatus Bipolaricaulis sp.]|nr:hypothetical protein [Candidatus Bipolaricaulis sp.]